MSSVRVVHARSPLRIDFVGMTDYVPACDLFGGSIVNATINKYIYATAMERCDGLIIFHAPDQGDKRFVVESKEALDPDGELGLAQEIVRRFDLKSGVELTTYSEMPAGAGLGSSSTIATCIIAALDALTGFRLTSYEMAELARECETVALRTTYGWQDQYSPVTGGGVSVLLRSHAVVRVARRAAEHPDASARFPRRRRRRLVAVLPRHEPHRRPQA